MNISPMLSRVRRRTLLSCLFALPFLFAGLVHAAEDSTKEKKVEAKEKAPAKASGSMVYYYFDG